MERLTYRTTDWRPGKVLGIVMIELIKLRIDLYSTPSTVHRQSHNEGLYLGAIYDLHPNQERILGEYQWNDNSSHRPIPDLVKHW